MDESLKQEEVVAAARVWSPASLTGALTSAWRMVIAHKAEALAGCLLLLMAANLFTTIARKSITADEIVMIPAAYYHLVTGNFQLVHEHPPLSKIIAAFPLLFIQPNEAKPQVIATATTQPQANWARFESFWNDNHARFFSISFWTRIPAALLTLALGVVIFYFTRELFSARAGVLAVFLYSFEPTFLAHGRVVQTDVPATLGMLLVCYTLYRYLKSRGSRGALSVGVATGIALLAKFSMLILAPLLLLVFIALLWQSAERSKLALHAGVTILASLVVVNAAYFFHSRPLTGEDAQWVANEFPHRASAVWTSVRWLSQLLPTDFVLGVYWQLNHGDDGHPAGLLGMFSQHGWWYYFPVAFALKTTIPFLLLSVTATAWATYRLVKNHERRFLILLVPLVIYTVFVMTSTINIGVRYFLPAYPFLIILGAVLLDRLLRRTNRISLLVVCLWLGWVGIEAVRAYPHQMSYMNQLASRQPHWHYLSDSNLEWGDDVGELGNYLKARGETRVRAMLLGGYSTLRFYGVQYIDAMQLTDPAQPDTRYIAIGASFINGSTVPRLPHLTEQQRVNFFNAYRTRTPEVIIGGSIYLFRTDE